MNNILFARAGDMSRDIPRVMGERCDILCHLASVSLPGGAVSTRTTSRKDSTQNTVL